MSIKLAEGERIIKSYDYGEAKTGALLAASKSQRNLTITNRRIISSCATDGMGKHGLFVNEMPIKSAKNVSTSYQKITYPILLVFGILCAIIGVGSMVVSLIQTEGASKMGILIGFVGLVVAASFIFKYFKKRDCVLTLSILTEGLLSNAMSLRASSGNSLTRKWFKGAKIAEEATILYVFINVDPEVARVMTEEIGSVILDAANGVYGN